MNSGERQAPGKSIGQGMLIASFTLALVALTFFFDGWLGRQANPNQTPEFRETGAGVKKVVLQRNRQGHYVAGGTINGIAVTFLLDTGATDVAVPENLASEAGLVRGYTSQANTANGVVTIYSTRITELELGNIVLSNVAASITPSMQGNTILLGMSALQQVEFTQRGSTLTLRQF